MAMAQGSPTTFWYSGDTSSSSFTTFLIAVVDAEQPPLVISISYSISEHFLTFYEVLVFDMEAKKLAIQGVTLVAASGDAGVAGDAVYADGKDTCGYNPIFPASSPFVLAVGGTQGPERGRRESGCQTDAGASAVTSGGGLSNIYEQPPWQRPHVGAYFAHMKTPYSARADMTFNVSDMNYPFATYNPRGAAYPDVSLLAVGYVTAINSSFYPIDGTSASTPVVAAMLSLVNSARLAGGKPPIGWLNPALYLLNSSFTRDVVAGENRCRRGGGTGQTCCREGFSAAPGWYELFEGLSLSHVTSMTHTVSPFPFCALLLRIQGTPSLG